MTASPKIDNRTALDVVGQVEALLELYAPEVDATTGVAAALVGIFGRFAEIIIQRLNEVPQKNFLAFLDLLGASLQPPQPARVPLTFFLAAGSAVDGLVPAGTQIASPPDKSEKDPVIFETERELTVTAAQLASLFARDPEQDEQADLGSIIAAASESGQPVFKGNRSIEHFLYLGHNRLLGFPRIADLVLMVNLEKEALQDSREVQWEFWNGREWERKTPAGDLRTRSLVSSGEISLGATIPVPEAMANAISNRWLRARLLTPVSISNEAQSNMVRASQLPKVRKVLLRVHLLRPLIEGLLAEAAFTNGVPVELGKDFFPFGEKPKLNDALYLASAETFSKDAAGGLAPTGASVQLDISVTNSHLLPALSAVRPSADLLLAWECWNGTVWQRVGTSKAPTWLRLLEVDPPPEVTAEPSVAVQGRAQRGAHVTAEVTDPTGATTPQAVSVAEDGRFALSVSPKRPGLTVITFTASFGKQTTKAWATFFQESAVIKRTVELVVAAQTQPIRSGIKTLTVNVTPSANPVTAVRVTNGSNGSDVVPGSIGSRLRINLVQGRNELLIEGLSKDRETLAATTLTVSRQANPPPHEAVTGFVDGTHAFCQSGIVKLTLPKRVAPFSVSGQENFWLRARIIRGDYGKDAGYKLKRPEAPEDGFTLILESFRSPMLSSVKIGYDQMLTGPPEVMLTYNNSTFVRVTNPEATGPAFEPFSRVPEDRPTLYTGFALPPERTSFPNRTISLYARLSDFKYRERSIPISPESSKRFGAPTSTAIHKFLVTNTAGVPARLTFSVFGARWQPSPSPIPASMELTAGASQEVEVQITIPDGTPAGSSDRGFLMLENSAKPNANYTADFVTVVGEEAERGERVRLVWEYWNGNGWPVLTVRDGTENFTRSGLIEFLAPADFAVSSQFGQQPQYWLRVRWEKGEFASAPRLRRMLLNTTMAAQTVTRRNEILGSSDGSGEQKFRSTRAPILMGPRLEVRETEMPASAEQEIISREEGEDAITVVRDPSGRPKEIWVRWHELADFYGSGTRGRHYVLDHLTGEIRFGDGLNGLIPPTGAGNIRMSRYQIGGGSAGNRPAGAIVQLKTTVPYVDKVTNTEAAAGGADAESLDSLLVRAPRTIRHGNRAVTIEDYEDLAMLATPEVARARCVPLRNLTEDPLGLQPTVRGEVSVIIVPRSRDAKPQASMELIERVRAYLTTQSVATASVSVVGPLYVRVNVTAEIALASLEGATVVEQAAYQTIAAFLHPLTGGPDKNGWEFGREPHKSDLYALIESVPGVDHIRTLSLEVEDQPRVRDTGLFLVYSGVHKISLVFE